MIALALATTITLADLEYGARTVRAEARGEPFEGQVAVAHAIINRVKARYRRENTIAGVVLEPRQFSAWNDDDPNRKAAALVPWSDPTLQTALRALLIALDEDRRGVDPIGGALHYKTKRVRPRWARGVRPYVTIGNHQFYVGIQ